MAVPLKKVTILNQELVRRLENDDFIQDHEIFSYRRRLQEVDDKSLEGISTWAFYYACRNDNINALKCFRKSMHFNDPNFFCNYLVFLKNCGLVEEYINAIQKSAGKYDGLILIAKERSQAYFWQGDVALISKGLLDVIKIANDDVRETYIRLSRDLSIFIERSALSAQDFEALMRLTTNFVDKNSIPYSHPGIVCLDDRNSNYFFVNSTLSDLEKIRSYNFLYAISIAEISQFDDKNFMASIVSKEMNIGKALDMDITYEDGYYIAECDAIHLVTESKSLVELHDFILELTPDLIELNEIDLDPEKVLFNFNFSLSAKKSIRGH